MGDGSAEDRRDELATQFRETLERFERAHADERVGDLRACFHDDAVIESIASGGLPLGPDETAEAIQRALTDGIYSIRGWQYEELEPELVLCGTAARHRMPNGGVIDHTVVRLMVGRDGLIWRVKMFERREQALEYLQTHGDAWGSMPRVDAAPTRVLG
jgi:hypothetical protein